MDELETKKMLKLLTLQTIYQGTAVMTAGQRSPFLSLLEKVSHDFMTFVSLHCFSAIAIWKHNAI